MRILLSGCEGQLGRALTVVLPSCGELHPFAKADFDLISEPAMLAVLDRVRPDLVINAAAYTAVDQAETEPALAMAVNGAGPGVIARWAAKNDAALLHYSTDYVFDGVDAGSYRESDPVCPANRYGATKLAGEQAIRNSGARHLIVRTSWLYDGVGRNFLTSMLRLAAEREELRVVDDQTGAPTPAAWLAEATVRILAGASGVALFQADSGGILHAAAAGQTSWHGFAVAIIEEARRSGLPVKAVRVVPVPSSAYPTPARRPRHSVFALDRLREEFGVSPPPWRAALSQVFETIFRTGA
ncbi:MAG: dTDP-4-dehydrorhamnose reductase [Alphaproteobacteria bacterium]